MIFLYVQTYSLFPSEVCVYARIFVYVDIPTVNLKSESKVSHAFLSNLGYCHATL